MKTKQEEFSFEFARSLMLVLVDFFVLSFVLPCAYAYVATENHALDHDNIGTIITEWKRDFLYLLYSIIW